MRTRSLFPLFAFWAIAVPSPSAMAQSAPAAPPTVAGRVQSENFFAQLKSNPRVVQTSTGLRYEIIKQGHGGYPRATDIVRVNYAGTLIDGTVFDSTFRPGAVPQPVEFELDQVIDGWTEGIQRINQGGVIKLYIPANLAYGDKALPGVPAGSTLIFQVELLAIKRP